MSTSSLSTPAPPPDPRYELLHALGDRIRNRVRRWLGLSDYEQILLNHQQLIEGQRRDYDALSTVLQAKDAENTARDRSVAMVAEAAGEQAKLIGHVNDRLSYYERTVLPIQKARHSYDRRIEREVARRDALIAANPGLSEEGVRYVRRTGELPTAAAVPEPAPAPAPEP